MRVVYISLFLFLFAILPVRSQNFSAGILPEISLSYQWSEKIQQTVKIESMHEMYTPDSQEPRYYYEQTDVQIFLEGRINPFIRVAGGYQYRFEGQGENAHRSIQQISFLQRKQGFRLGHRLRTDQTFVPSEAIQWRFRYRLSAEVPLQGQSLDDGEFYLKFSGEPIFSVHDAERELETRLSTSLGFLIHAGNKLELGPDYRLEDIMTKGAGHDLWMKLGWFYLISK